MWLRLTGPRAGALSSDAAGRERLRRSRLLSVLTIVMLIVMVAAFPKGFIPILDPGTFGAVAICGITLILCIPLNRTGFVNAACAIFCTGVALALAWGPLATPGGIGMEDLPSLDLFALPIVLAGILLPRRWPFIFWIACALFIIGDVTLEEHHANLAAYVQEVGLYATVIIPLILTFVIAVVSWLGAGSVERAIVEADRTTDLEQAYSLMAEQNQRLEVAVSTIQGVHARVANGDLNARAPAGAGELMGLSASLNLMLDRLARLRGAENALNTIENGSRVLAQYAWELGAGNLQFAPPQLGLPMLDIIGAALDQMRRAIYGEISALVAAVQGVTRAGEELMGASRGLGWQFQESARRIGALNDFVQAMRTTAERAESSLIAPADWLEQATAQGWSDGEALARTVAEGLSNVRQVVAMADQSPSGLLALDASRSGEREVLARAGAAEREFTEMMTQARVLLSRLANQTNALAPPQVPPQ
jgi:hypothetical protein